jgi:hypothetical protein
VAAVEHAAAGLLERVGSMENEVSALVDSLRAGARRLASDLSAVEGGMHELYDAAAGQGAQTSTPSPAPQAPPAAPEPAPEPAPVAATPPEPEPEPASPPTSAEPEQEPKQPVPGDLDGARLVALNMALNGESRADTERYLAENFELPDRLKLIDEVYAAVEG